MFVPQQDWIVQQSSTTGLGAFDLSATLPPGTSYFPFRRRFANGATVPTYWVINNNPTAKGTKWEKYRDETLTYGPPLDQLSRANIEASTNSDGPVNWQADDLPLLIYIVPDIAAAEFAVTMGLGAARPDVLRYGLWSDEDGVSAGVDQVYLYDGASDIRLFQVDRTNHLVHNLRVKVTTYAANDTWTPDDDMVSATLETWGGGGGGGGAAATGANQQATGGGGGAGGYSRKTVARADVGATETVTVGAGGTFGVGLGGTGGVTSVGSLCVANGGAGGGGGAAGGGGSGGLGGAAGTGDIAATGAPGHASNTGTAIGAVVFGGNGGSSLVGGGGRGGTNSTGGTASGHGSGGGGAGGYNGTGNLNGGGGAAGYVVITEYCRV